MKFQTVKGVHVPCCDCLIEGFEITKRNDQSSHVRINVSAEKIDSVFESIVMEISEPGFLVVEVPCNESKEREIRKSESDPYHKDIYYLDGLSRYDFLKIYSDYSDIFINDGFTHYGFGSHDEKEEIFVGSYKIFHLYTSDFGRYSDVLDRYGLGLLGNLTTAWDTFTKEKPGVRSRWDRDGLDVFEVIERLMRNNRLYLAKTVEE